MGCADAVDAELATMEEGLALALHWSPLAITLETDCAEAVALVPRRLPTHRDILRVFRLLVN